MIYYKKIHDPTRALEYIEKKLESVSEALGVDERRDIAADIVARSTTESPPPSLATSEQHPRHSARQRNYLVRRADIDGPLLGDERLVEEDFASFLREDFLDIPAGTVVLRRRTTHAEFYYFLLCVHVKDGQINRRRMRGGPDVDTVVADDEASVALPSSGSKAPAAIVPRELDVKQSSDILGDIALELAKALVGGIGKSIGTKVFNLIFGKMASVPAWFGEVYEKFVEAVHEALNEQWKKAIEVEIRTVADLVNLYNTTGNKVQLQEAETLSVRLVNNMEVYGASLVANYLTGAGLQLLVFQQQALIAPEPGGYEKAIKDRAKRFSEWALKSRETVIADRLSKITAVAAEKVGTTQGWGFEDRATGQKWWYPDIPGAGKSGKPNADRAHASHRANVDAAMIETMKPVLGVTAEWRKLIDQPLPPHDA
ncbi:hypothetical protein BO221_44135 [Archangium sp. Cb G35]|uniref:hypothetical protein n=1 Tax=Archangium sp. Cb G35 TaxID=1920190 RepID=UPI000936007B|nr:hypothetical protein [Archangium sp. Cb G35]OJT17566.1 hypothetical protein BO221_44135 [Archangium sp. Cb G35]